MIAETRQLLISYYCNFLSLLSHKRVEQYTGDTYVEFNYRTVGLRHDVKYNPSIVYLQEIQYGDNGLQTTTNNGTELSRLLT